MNGKAVMQIVTTRGQRIGLRLVSMNDGMGNNFKKISKVAFTSRIEVYAANVAQYVHLVVSA
tara:strand:+ start:39 stop:224 length:186 start_codon:yes stop_codon:yes gene_type:complete